MPKLSIFLNQGEIKNVQLLLDITIKNHENPELVAIIREIRKQVALNADLSKEDIIKIGTLCDGVANKSGGDTATMLRSIMEKLCSRKVWERYERFGTV